MSGKKSNGNQKHKAELETIMGEGSVIEIGPCHQAACWKKVEDEMPDDETTVLVCTNEEFHLAWHDSELGCWLREELGRIDGVTHWMELIPPNSEPLTDN